MRAPFLSWLLTGRAGQSAPAQPRDPKDGLLGARLDAVLSTDLFTFFHLEPAGESVTVKGEKLSRFQPSGPSFHDLVTLEVQSDTMAVIHALRLLIARSFIDSPKQGIFAADIAKSFLLSAVPSGDRSLVTTLADEIQTRPKTGQTVIVRQGTWPAEPLGPPSAAYQVYSGKADSWQDQVGRTRVRLSRKPANWLTIEVAEV